MAESFRLGEHVLPAQARWQVSTLAGRLPGSTQVAALFRRARSLLIRRALLGSFLAECWQANANEEYDGR